ncbi:MAG: carboxypeptidase regulatory-like domain-containing protein, partial [Verrucomicrobia bacterium]|nr:carboxypeptidase regulatory-like domain-containing protein [Verrucomicrobiota bacterium]
MTKSCLFLRSRWTTAFVLILALAGATSAADQAKKSYQLPAGDAAATLKRFSELSGEQIVYPVDVVRGVQTNALSGELTARDALDRLVAGTELRVVQDASSGALAINRAASSGGVGSIEGRVFNPANGSYVNNARVTIDAQRLETFTDEYGLFRFPRVPAGDATVRVNYTGFPLESQVVKVAAGQAVVQEFSLRSSKASAEDTTVKLDAFTVAAKRDM